MMRGEKCEEKRTKSVCEKVFFFLEQLEKAAITCIDKKKMLLDPLHRYSVVTAAGR